MCVYLKKKFSILQESIDIPKNAERGNAILHIIDLREYIDEMKQLILNSRLPQTIENRVRSLL